MKPPSGARGCLGGGEGGGESKEPALEGLGTSEAVEQAEGWGDGTVDPAVEGLGGHGEGLQLGRRRRNVGEGMVGAGEALVHMG